MKKLLLWCLLLLSTGANAQFTPGQLLTAAELNSQFALYAPLAGATFTGPVVFSGSVSGSGITTLLGPYALLASPTFTGTVTVANFTATGTVSLPSASVPLTGLAAQAANTVVANVTAGSASPTAFAMPSCSGATNALTYTISTGFTCNSAVNASTLGGATFASPGAIGSGTASTGAFTNLSSSGTVSGTGFSTYLASPPAIGGTAAAAGKFTTLQATSTITPSTTSGIVGTTLADNANAGSVGEVISSTVLAGSAISLSNGVAANVTSINLTAGDWDVWGQISYAPAGSTVIVSWLAQVSLTSATFPGTITSNAAQYFPITLGAGQGPTATTGILRVNVSTTTTVYLTALSGFSTSTNSAYGYIIARRRR